MSAYRKALAALSSALVVAGSLIVGGELHLADWIAIAAAFAGALSVYQVANVPKS